jgi:hypothetical protein
MWGCGCVLNYVRWITSAVNRLSYSWTMTSPTCFFLCLYGSLGVFVALLMTLLHEATFHRACDLARPTRRDPAAQNAILDTAWAPVMPLRSPCQQIEFWVRLYYLEETSFRFWNLTTNYFLFVRLSVKEMASQRSSGQKEIVNFH